MALRGWPSPHATAPSRGGRGSTRVPFGDRRVAAAAVVGDAIGRDLREIPIDLVEQVRLDFAVAPSGDRLHAHRHVLSHRTAEPCYAGDNANGGVEKLYSRTKKIS